LIKLFTGKEPEINSEEVRDMAILSFEVCEVIWHSKISSPSISERTSTGLF